MTFTDRQYEWGAYIFALVLVCTVSFTSSSLGLQFTPAYAFRSFVFIKVTMAMACVLVLCRYLIPEWDRWHKSVPMIIVMAAIMVTTPSFLAFTVFYTPVLDLYAAAFEAQLGLGGIETMIAGFFIRLGLAKIILWIYCALTVAAMLLLALLPLQRARHFMKTWVLGYTIGYCIYALTPMVGPAITALYNPATTLSSAAHPFYPAGIAVLEPRNAMPSLHILSAILLICFSRGLPVLLRAVFWLFALLSILATVVLLEHWVFDGVIALPLTATALLLTTPCPRKPREDIYALLAFLVLLAGILTLHFQPGLLVQAAPLFAALFAAAIAVSAMLCRRWTKPEQSS